MEKSVDCLMELSYNEEELLSVAEKLISVGKDNSVWVFEGEMGAGKTTLIKAIAKGFSIIDVVSSPTFSLVNEYRNTKNEVFYHFDFYRIKNEEEASDIGVDEYFHSGDYCFVEWPSLIPSLLPDDYILVELTIVSTTERKLCISKKGIHSL